MATRPAFHSPTLEDALANIDAHFRRPAPLARSTPEQMAAARAAARRVTLHDGLPPGYRMVAGEPWCFGTSARSEDIDALLATRALQIAAE
jgi:hypothetical protein